jgi:hypothetical protein
MVHSKLFYFKYLTKKIAIGNHGPVAIKAFPDEFGANFLTGRCCQTGY